MFFYLLTGLSYITCYDSVAQQKLSLEDAILGPYTKFRKENLDQLKWRPNSNDFVWTSNDTIWQENVKDNEPKVLITLTELNETLEKNGKGNLLRIPAFDWKNQNLLRFRKKEYFFDVNILTGELSSFLELPEHSENADISSKGVAYTLGNNIFITLSSGEKIRVSYENDPGIKVGQIVSRNEFGINKGTFWSPLGNFLAYYWKDERKVSDYPLVDIRDRVGALKMIKYPMAGMKSEIIRLGIFDVKTRNKIYLNTREPGDDYLTNITWGPEEKFIYVAVLNRAQNHLKLNKYNARSGVLVRTLFEETHKDYVEPLHPIRFLEKNPHWFIWESKRDGYNHVYLYSDTGEMLQKLTHGDFDVTDVVGFDADESHLVYISTQVSPVERHIYSVAIKTGKEIKISTKPGMHGAKMSTDGRYLIDTYSSITLPGKIDLVQKNGKLIRTLLKAKNPYGNFQLGEITLSRIKGKNGLPDLYYRLIKPVDFDPQKKYPVIVYVYGGPHSQLVTDSWLAQSRMWQHYMAGKGYVSFTLDGRGTEGRGFAFESVIHRQLGVLETEDQMRGVDYLKSLPWIDTTRMGVHGWSYGGFMTLNLMLREPGTFQVAVAGGPVTDWKYYEVMYGERYMDRPDENPEGYRITDMKKYVQNLKGKLLIIHGAMDSTVVRQHSMTFLRECIKKSVQLDYFVYPTHPHNIRGTDRLHLMEKVSNYFDEYLKN